MPVMVSLLSLTVDIGIELLCLMITTLCTKVVDVVMNFITILVISQLDEIYYQQISSTLKDNLISKRYELPIK